MFLSFLAAVALCSMEPLFPHHHEGHASEISEPAGHHDDGDHHEPTDGKGGHDDTFCVSLQNADHHTAALPIIKPFMFVSYVMAPLTVLPQDIHTTETQAVWLRQAKLRDCALPHEMYLGLAHQSHAPPCFT